MKNILLSAIAMAFVLVSCNQKNKEALTTNPEKTESTSQLYACSMHPEVTGKKGDKCSKCGMELTEPVATTESKTTDTITKVEETVVNSMVTPSDYVTDIITCYINLKNKLAKDDSKGAAEKGKMLLASFNRFDAKTLDAKQKKEYLDIADDAKEHAEHIGANGDKLEHQREHFVLLSKDINDLIKVFGTKRKLYQDYCPMADEGKGAIWISEVKDIKNPYQGSKMLTCGSIKKTY
ncbi:MAG: DUF3347 domain-containing protein [Bacteroidetes bacterium]|nr:DUF3347 domain-containing protein [Bacteroidota bacterium]